MYYILCYIMYIVKEMKNLSSIVALSIIMSHQGAESRRSFLGRLSYPLIKSWLPEYPESVIDYVKSCIDRMYYMEVR